MLNAWQEEGCTSRIVAADCCNACISMCPSQLLCLDLWACCQWVTPWCNLCRRIQVEMPRHQLQCFHFFNTFFFKKLTEKPSEAARERERRRLAASLGVAEGEDPLGDCKTQEERSARMNYQRVRKWTKVGFAYKGPERVSQWARSMWDLRGLPSAR